MKNRENEENVVIPQTETPLKAALVKNIKKEVKPLKAVTKQNITHPASSLMENTLKNGKYNKNIDYQKKIEKKETPEISYSSAKTPLFSEDVRQSTMETIGPLFESEFSEEFRPSPMSGKRLENPFIIRKRENSFLTKNNAFRADISKIAKNNRLKMKANKKNVFLTEREENFNLFKRVNLLRYRDNIFKAAGKISSDIPPFPIWAYKDLSYESLDIVTINVGGKKFEVFDDTLMNIPHSKLSNCYADHTGDPDLFFDRDSTCFNYVLNFFRTGRLHAPTNSCLSFFEEELQFWGINEDLMEPCCYSEYMAYKNTCDTLNMYSDLKINKNLPIHGNFSYINIKKQIYLITTSAEYGVLGRWYSITCGAAIIIAIIAMIFATSTEGRIDKTTEEYSERKSTESLVQFFARTNIDPSIHFIELLLVTFFLFDLLLRFTTSPNKLQFFSDTINWVDFIATFSSLLSLLPRRKHQAGNYEAFVLILKAPRIFRLFRLTKNLRSGMDALVLTLQARASELRLVLILTLLTMTMFGALIYVVELVNETNERISHFKSVYDGMWFAIVTMATVGYGELTPQSAGGYIVGFFCILTGIIISQLPVPIFLKNFSNFYTQLQSRERDTNKVLNHNIDPENFQEGQPESIVLKVKKK